MRAAVIIEVGRGPEIADIARPEPLTGEVQVKISAAGLNFADLLMIDGKYQEHPAPPFVLGMEAAGEVTALGPGVTQPAVGTRVAVFASHGALAEYGCFEAARCQPLPEVVGFAEAAAVQVAYGTAHVALHHRAQLQPGERLLVLGAAGGTGLAAVEIGRLMGAEVTAVARGASKLAIAGAAGAQHLIDSDAGNLREVVRALGGADVCFDPVGGALGEAAMRAMRPEGRIIPIGFASGQVPNLPANLLLVKNLSVLGVYWGGYQGFRPEVVRESLDQIFGWCASGKIRPHISHTLPLERTCEALDLLRSRRATGKVVIARG